MQISVFDNPHFGAMASSRWGAKMWKMPARCQLDQTGSSPNASRLSWCSTPEISHSIVWVWLGIECLCLCSLWSLLCVLWSSCSLWSLTTFTLCNTADEFDIVAELVVPHLYYKQLLWIQSQKCTIARVLRALGTSLILFFYKFILICFDLICGAWLKA